jgi:hypothetical protein
LLTHYRGLRSDIAADRDLIVPSTKIAGNARAAGDVELHKIIARVGAVLRIDSTPLFARIARGFACILAVVAIGLALSLAFCALGFTLGEALFASSFACG